MPTNEMLMAINLGMYGGRWFLIGRVYRHGLWYDAIGMKIYDVPSGAATANSWSSIY